MKKIVALGLAAALVGGFAFADPASNPSVASWNGNAAVEWGVDLDAGKTGFNNSTWTEIKFKLFDGADKSLEAGDGVWAELLMQFNDDGSGVAPAGIVDGSYKGTNMRIEAAKLHFGDFYVNIKSGDVKTGELDVSSAVKSGDPWFHPGRWLQAVGPSVKVDDKTTYDFANGITLGYANNNIGLEIDFRSLNSTRYSDAYAVAAEVALKGSNEWVEGLEAKAGVSTNISDIYYTEKDNVGTKVETLKDCRYIGYSASAAYKLAIDDTYYVKPMAGITGMVATAESDAGKSVGTTGEVVASLLFGWGATQSYGSTGQLYYFDDDWGDKAKGLTPGLSVVAKIPLATVGTFTPKSGDATKSTEHAAKIATIVPSFYLGNDLVPGLKAAAYAEIGLYNGEKDDKVDATSIETWGCAKDKDATTAMAVVAGFSYDIKSDDLTITPKASFRYANAAYVDNNAKADIPESSYTLFNDLGNQKKKTEAGKTDLYDGDFFNLTASVNVAGLINNTDFYLSYVSQNLLNDIDYGDATMYNVKSGTFNVGCKIHY